MPDTPEAFSSVLEALADEGRAHAHPIPAPAIHALGRSRQRRQRLAVATSGVLACAVAVGVVATTRGGGSGTTPLTPGPTPKATSTPATSKAADAGKFLLAAELPDPARQWRRGPLFAEPHLDFPVRICGANGKAGPPAVSQARSAEVVQFTGQSRAGGTAGETIYHYDSAAAANSMYVQLFPHPEQCAADPIPGTTTTTTQTADAGLGFAVSQISTGGSVYGLIEHVMVAVSGKDLAVYYQSESARSSTYDTTADQAALRQMLLRLQGTDPTTAPATPPTSQNPATIPAGAWLKAEEVPFAAADKSHGWYLMSPPAAGDRGQARTGSTCSGMMYGIAASPQTEVVSQMWHGTPDATPVGPGNYLYSDASEQIYRFPDAASAQAAFTEAQGIQTAKSCTFSDPGGSGTRTVTAGPHSTTAFSVAAADNNGADGYSHLYVAVKGADIVEVDIHFMAGANNTDFGKDLAFLNLMTSKLP